ncbi:hypothetical protein KHA80_20610 [Anaerobacillus sp. HL2]|nr:hypothetical protein KHA80_20610 [Anaerobacillus sp. HL2]
MENEDDRHSEPNAGWKSRRSKSTIKNIVSIIQQLRVEMRLALQSTIQKS